MSLTPNELAKLTGKPPANVLDQVNDVVLTTLTKLRTQFPDKPQLPMPEITYDLRGGVAGKAFGHYKIALNLDYLLDIRYQEDMLLDTIPHEVAHLACNLWWPSDQFTKRASHGPKWQFVMVKLGLNPKRTHEYEVRPARTTDPTKFLYECACPNRIHKLSKNRHSRINNGTNVYACTICNYKLTWNGGTE